ncbi:hypothetical protein Glove_166g259 [Diversispora epigaea]|uniref:Heterokaryon incompatibility domain-containing protein n=1 Tax=Diversispora epigaea TaxID=1348612 RepID=A0A397IWX7_9GLOM|nr:hypothetical protein Glove_166g259 [Diversispora epigaea]
MDKLKLKDINNLDGTERTFTLSIQGKVIEKGNIPKQAKEVCDGKAWLHVTMLELLVWFRMTCYSEIKIDTLHVLVDSQLGMALISRFIKQSSWELITLHAETLEDANYLMNKYNDTRNNFVVIRYDENLKNDIDFTSHINTFDNAFQEHKVDNPHEENVQQSTILYDLKVKPRRLLDVVNCQVIDSLDTISDEYSIISHVWGNAIYDCATDVGTTYRALLESKEKLLMIINIIKTLGRRYVWIDALCINQDDINEKSNEIPFMGIYYANCQECIVLLEPQTDSMEEISSTFHICSRNFLKFEKPVNNCEYTLDKCSAQFFNMLGTCKWITRVWTVQEALLPKVIKYVICGSYMCEKANIRKTLEIIDKNRNNEKTPSAWFEWNTIKKNLHNDNGEVWRITHDIEHRECLNPADKVFGLLGITGYGSLIALPYYMLGGQIIDHSLLSQLLVDILIYNVEG